MDRRSFLTSTAADVATWVLAAETVHRQLQGTGIDLPLFCSDAHERYDLRMPYHQSGKTYATNRAIAVRTSLVVPPAAAPSAPRPPLARLRWTWPAVYADWPARPERVRHAAQRFPCPRCDGRQRIGPDVTRCGLCNGDGRMPLNWAAPCPDCDGTGCRGGVSCTYCEEGQVDFAYRLGREVVCPSLYAKAATLPDLRWLEPQEAHAPTRGRVAAIRLQFRGGEGLMMPLTPG